MLRTSENPPVLSPGLESLADLPGRWWVGHTRSRFEKAFAWELLRLGIPHFLPMYESLRRSGGKKRRALLPLFPSYVFFCGDENDRYMAIRTNRLFMTIDVADQEGLVGELTSIQKVIRERAQLDPYPFAAVGQRCRIKGGSFKGLEGVVIRRGCVARVVLQVRILGQGAALEVDADLLDPVD